MYSEMTMQELYDRVKADAERARDVIAPSNALALALSRDASADTEHQKGSRLLVQSAGSFAYRYPVAAYLNETAEDQLAYRLGIPPAYFRRMKASDANALSDDASLSDKGLLIENCLHWMATEPRQYMLRTMAPRNDAGETVCRAILSDRYLRVDNLPVLQAAALGMERAKAATGERIELLSSGLTDKRMYVTMLFPNRSIDLGTPDKPDMHRPGFTIKNSETGFGAMGIYAFLYRDRCTNGMIFGKNELMGFERRHVGRVREEGVMSPETHQKLLELIESQTTDVVRAMLDPRQLESLVRPLREARESGPVRNAFAAFQELARVVDIRGDEREAALEHFIRDADYSRFGMAQAVTRLANAERSYERTVELAEAGADVINLPRRKWERIALAEAA